MKMLFFSFGLFFSMNFLSNDMLLGRWETKVSPNGNVTGVVFKSDNSFEGYVNKKPFVSGQYSIKDSIMTMIDNGCEGKEAVYKIVLFSNSDSLRFDYISDPCEPRKRGMKLSVFGRVKK